MTEFHESLGMDAATSAAFWVTYGVLMDWGVSLAEVRRDAAEQVVVRLLELRRQHGTGHMLFVAQCAPEDRQHIVNQIHAALPETYTSVTRGVVAAAVVAAAGKFADA